MLNGAVTRPLVSRAEGWQKAAMATPSPRSSRAGGSILALAILIGVVAGSLLGEPSIGFLAGIAIGLGAVGLLWLADRRA